MTRIDLFRTFGILLASALTMPAHGQDSSAPSIDRVDSYPAGDSPGAFDLADLNGDGNLDLVVASTSAKIGETEQIYVMLGTGGGGFGAATSFDAGGRFPKGLVIHDLNADGKLDLAIANHQSNTVSVFLGKGDGAFAAPNNFPAGKQPNDLAVGDLNLDGKPDLVVSNESASEGNESGLLESYTNNVAVLMARGGGAFAAPTFRATGRGEDGPTSVAIGDLNGDRYPDVVAANTAYAFKNTVSVFINERGSLANGVKYPVQGRSPGTVLIGQFDDDQLLDLLVTSASDNMASFVEGKGDGTFVSPAESIEVGGRQQAVAQATLRSGKKMVAFRMGSRVFVILEHDPDNIVTTLAVDELGDWGGLALADVNQDGLPDLIMTDFSNSAVKVAVMQN